MTFYQTAQPFLPKIMQGIVESHQFFRDPKCRYFLSFSSHRVFSGHFCYVISPFPLYFFCFLKANWKYNVCYAFSWSPLLYLCSNSEFLVCLGISRTENWMLAFLGFHWQQRPNLNNLFHAWIHFGLANTSCFQYHLHVAWLQTKSNRKYLIHIYWYEYWKI